MIDFLRRFHLFFTALVFLFLAFLILTHSREGREVSLPERGLLRITAPLQEKIQQAISWTGALGDRYLFLVRVEKENQELKKSLIELKEENNRLREDLLAAGRLERLLNLPPPPASPSLLAQVIARDPSTWFKTVLVNKGEGNGVARDMAVMAAQGVVGRVIEVSTTTAKVLLITDPNSAVDVIIQRSRTQGIMEGKMEQLCILKYVQKSEDVQVGDRVITSGLGGIFPKGVLIGTVTGVDRKRPGVFQHVEVRPTVDLSRLEEVLILEEDR